jgi:hypothetical protein
MMTTHEMERKENLANEIRLMKLAMISTHRFLTAEEKAEYIELEEATQEYAMRSVRKVRRHAIR